MSDYDAVLSALDDLRVIPGHVVFTPVTAAAVAYARATAVHREVYMDRNRWRERDAADEAQEDAWEALRDIVVAALGPSEQEDVDA